MSIFTTKCFKVIISDFRKKISKFHNLNYCLKEIQCKNLQVILKHILSSGTTQWAIYNQHSWC